MRYLPHTDADIEEMLQVAGKQSLDALFATIPAQCRYEGAMDLPFPLNEWSLVEHMHGLEKETSIDPDYHVLLGAGRYHHYIPETIRALTARSEFLTSYTPYQPEISQGTLQGIYEYQSLTARLLGMDVVNASMYDGASALAEAILMALRIAKKKNTVAIASNIHPHFREVVKTYLAPTSYRLVELPYDKVGRADLSSLGDLGDLAAVAIQSPNFFGVIEQLEVLARDIHRAGALLVHCFTEPLSYGLLKNPGSCGADIVCGEGQSFGMARSFGGAGLGMFGCRREFLRSMPGRLVGETVDVDGRRGFVLTLSTREQHIRREKATSNICSNQGICALTAAMYMASLGGTGIRDLAQCNYDKAQYLRNGLKNAGAQIVFESPTFNEFVVGFRDDFSRHHQKLAREKIVAGLELGHYCPELQGKYLFCVTETVPRKILDKIIEEVR